MTTESNGMPIYLDETPRSVTDPMAAEEIEVDAWYPSNKAAQKLWCCLESMRDLDSLLELIGAQKNATKRKRKLKLAITPLYSFIVSIDDLINDIQTNPDTRNRVDADQLPKISSMQKEFAQLLPHDHKAEISTLRNKLSSHIDKKLHPTAVQDLAQTILPSTFGRWLHICIHLILDLTKLNIYSWSCDAPNDDLLCFMFNEPFIVTLQPESEAGPRMVALNVAGSSPRNVFPEVADSLIKQSQWMFKKGQQRIQGLFEDKKDEWNTFSPNLKFHEDQD
ncbi:hypothetical protein [Oceanicoccus sp. KOV_DT_Chl]|uniref:hypothetical protein n=1 Tax=Oceanicoccus sp. KOV_DT_Chl TaxID=1904639 RepID=UPI0011AF5C6C|nr:hypothetical protein [Oceanicoccus sp. KOV_DT_Chl]